MPSFYIEYINNVLTLFIFYYIIRKGVMKNETKQNKIG